MDVIYRGAEWTIIAAAGEDEKFGFPDVGLTFRTAQSIVTTGDKTIVSTMSHPHRTIPATKRVTRGWTYQEVDLSRRILVFSQAQT